MTDTMELADKRVVWTEGKLLAIKGMWATGHSASQIAAEFPGTTRNMICGMVHRNKFKRAEGYSKPAPMQPEVVQGAPKAPRDPQRAKRILDLAIQRMPEIVCEPVEANSLHLTIDQLQDHHCRWPELESADQTYCGLNVKVGRPYCGGHCLVAFVPLQPKVRPIRHAELKQSRGGVFGRSS